MKKGLILFLLIIFNVYFPLNAQANCVKTDVYFMVSIPSYGIGIPRSFTPLSGGWYVDRDSRLYARGEIDLVDNGPSHESYSAGVNVYMGMSIGEFDLGYGGNMGLISYGPEKPPERTFDLPITIMDISAWIRVENADYLHSFTSGQWQLSVNITNEGHTISGIVLDESRLLAYPEDEYLFPGQSTTFMVPATVVWKPLIGPPPESLPYRWYGTWEVNADVELIFSQNLQGVPLPPTVWLFGSGLLGLVGWRRFRKA